MCTVRVRYKDETTTYTFFVVLGDGLTMLGMPDIEVLDTPKITYEVMEGPHKSKMFNSQTV